MLLALLGKLGVVVTAVTASAVAGPILVKQFSSNEISYDGNGEKCLYFPIKSGNSDRKLYVCKKKEDNKTPIFRLWTKDGVGEKGMQEIETLSWNLKSQSTDITNNFELEVTLKGEGLEKDTIKEDGCENYVTSSSIKNMETNCTFKDTWEKGFILLCKKTDSVEERGHEIQIYE